MKKHRKILQKELVNNLLDSAKDISLCTTCKHFFLNVISMNDANSMTRHGNVRCLVSENAFKGSVNGNYYITTDYSRNIELEFPKVIVCLSYKERGEYE